MSAVLRSSVSLRVLVIYFNDASVTRHRRSSDPSEQINKLSYSNTFIRTYAQYIPVEVRVVSDLLNVTLTIIPLTCTCRRQTLKPL